MIANKPYSETVRNNLSNEFRGRTAVSQIRSPRMLYSQTETYQTD